MSDSEDKNIDKIFNEIMSSNIFDDLDMIQDPKKVIKELLHIQESLAESLLNINSIIYQVFTDDEYTIAKEAAELIGPLFKVSEDFISTMLQLTDTMDLEDFFEEDDEEEEDEDQDE